MRIVTAHRFGGPEVLEATTAPDPTPGPGQVTIDVSAADVLYLDTLLRSGWGGDFFPVVLPYVPGSGVAGVVGALGEGVDPSWLGRPVVAGTGVPRPDGSPPVPAGGYAEKAVAQVEDLVVVPDGLAGSDAVALLHDGPTMLQLLGSGDVRAGQRVLVTAAAGGAGVLLVEALLELGATVVGAARGQRKLDLVRGLGAHDVVDYSHADWVTGATTPDGRFDVVFDGAGGPLGLEAVDATADGGRFVTYGTSGGEFTTVEPGEVTRRGLRVTNMLGLPTLSPGARAELVGRALAGAEAGRLRPVIGQTYPLERAAEAHAAIAGRTAVGKTLLTV